MKILLKVLLVIAILIGIVALIGVLSPSKVGIERSITINASPASIYEEVISLRKSNKWSPWFQIDPEGTTYVHSGPEEGVGCKMEWASDHEDVGTGSQEIVEAVENEKIRTKLYFGGFDEPSFANFLFNETEEGTEVTWTFEGDMGSNPINKLFGLFMDGLLGPSYEEGLANLKARVESKPLFTVDMTITTVEPINYLAIREVFDVTNPESIGPRMGEIYGQLLGYIDKNGVKGMGMPMSVYVNNSETEWEAEVAMPVAETGEVSDENIIAGQTVGGRVLKGIHMGDYFKLDDTHKQMQAYIQFNELESNGQEYEIYVSDPTEADTALWRTDVYYPIK
ncbi:MAG: SRPBCC family protein [Reichenbachiella sp.]|uniref:SRPBCC family protein n=1 Tax=Reichenbachiella sp. TaxID=2184521 RepID=UPI0032670985